MRRGFTLIEITLALGVLATGVLSIVGLYAFGYRESQQSREDIGAAAIADIIFSQLSAAVSNPELTWAEFDALPEEADEAGDWGDYLNGDRVKPNPTATAQQIFTRFAGKLKLPDGSSPAFPSTELSGAGLECGLVISREGSLVRFTFRATANPKQLMSSPLFYGSAKFMGVKNGSGGSTK